MDFITAYNKIRRYDNPQFSLVTKPRCQELWELVEEVKDLEGDFIEVGIWRGGTAALIGQQIINLNLNNKLYLCDTFTGVVKSGKEDKFYNNGEHADTSLQIVDELFTNYFKFPKDLYEILVGIFPEETGNKIVNKKFKYVHLDVDVYQSTKDAFEFLFPYMVKGGIIIIDDYKWSGCTGIEKYVNELRVQSSMSLTVKDGKAPYHAIIIK